MLAYTVGFGLLSVEFVRDDLENHYNLIYIIEGAVCYSLIFIGNLIYAFNFANSKIRMIWKFLFPIIILDFIGGGIIDSIYGKSAKDDGAVFSLFVWIVSILLFFPTFKAAYMIGYGKEAIVDDAN
jgi:hypothetical protein